MHSPHPLMATFERSIVLTNAEHSAVAGLPFTLENVLPGDGPGWAGDRPTRSFLVLEGMLCTSKTLRSGTVQITAFHVPGDMPDLRGLHLEVLDSDIAAIGNCRVAYMAHKDLRQFCEEHPRLAAVLWRATLLDDAIAREWLVNVAQRQAINRLAHLFCEMMLRMRATGLADDDSCHLGLTQMDMGEATGLSIVHVNRTMQELRAQGLISYEKGTLTIHNWDALVRLGDFDPAYLHLPMRPPQAGAGGVAAAMA